MLFNRADSYFQLFLYIKCRLLSQTFNSLSILNENFNLIEQNLIQRDLIYRQKHENCSSIKK